MLTRRIDAALMAMTSCRMRIPDLRDVYRPGTAERTALDELLGVLDHVNDVLTSPDAQPPLIQ